MRDFGRVGHIVNGKTDVVFMVVGGAASPEVRTGKPDYRKVIVLSGIGYTDHIHEPGDLGAVISTQDNIEWLDD